MKTIKQIADDLGLSKQRVYRYVKNNNISASKHDAHQRNTTKYYDYVTESRIKAHFFNEKSRKNMHHADVLYDAYDAKTASNSKIDDTVDAIIVMLKNELDTKNQQIADLTSALVTAQQTAAAAQALHAGTMNHLAITDKKKPGLWSRFFGRKKDSLRD